MQLILDTETTNVSTIDKMSVQEPLSVISTNGLTEGINGTPNSNKENIEDNSIADNNLVEKNGSSDKIESNTVLDDLILSLSEEKNKPEINTSSKTLIQTDESEIDTSANTITQNNTPELNTSEESIIPNDEHKINTPNNAVIQSDEVINTTNNTLIQNNEQKQNTLDNRLIKQNTEPEINTPDNTSIQHDESEKQETTNIEKQVTESISNVASEEEILSKNFDNPAELPVDKIEERQIDPDFTQAKESQQNDIVIEKTSDISKDTEEPLTIKQEVTDLPPDTVIDTTLTELCESVKKEIDATVAEEMDTSTDQRDLYKDVTAEITEQVKVSTDSPKKDTETSDSAHGLATEVNVEIPVKDISFSPLIKEIKQELPDKVAENLSKETNNKECDDTTLSMETDSIKKEATNSDDSTNKNTSQEVISISSSKSSLECVDANNSEEKFKVSVDVNVKSEVKDEPVSMDWKVNETTSKANETSNEKVLEVMDLDDVIEVTNDTRESAIIDCDAIPDIENEVSNSTKIDSTPNQTVKPEQDNVDLEKTSVNTKEKSLPPEKDTQPKKVSPTVSRLSNTLDILSDEEEDASKNDTPQAQKQPETTKPIAAEKSSDKQCINIEDDDDIMLIDEDSPSKDKTEQNSQNVASTEKAADPQPDKPIDVDAIKDSEPAKISDDSRDMDTELAIPEMPMTEKELEKEAEKVEPPKALLPESFLKLSKKNLAEMTRDELEEFCILKVVESVIDRSNLNDIRTKLKSLTQNLEDYKKKAMMLTKQNRDLQVVLKSVQEEQKKMPDTPITPLKITRSVGMQVLMTEKRKKPMNPQGNNITPNPPSPFNNLNRIRLPTSQGIRPQKSPVQQIPVPRLVPAANNPATKSPQTPTTFNIPKMASPTQNGIIRNVTPVIKAEKRNINKVQSVTVDLTDDEPPAKFAKAVVPPVRLLPQQNLLGPRQQSQVQQSPRKVYIPISGPQSNRPAGGQTVMLKGFGPGQRPRAPSQAMIRPPQSNIRMTRLNGRHPAPLPDAMKQYQPPNWKALPPAPDLKLSKVENGIVISWKIDGYLEETFEEIASYQLYAYQETSSPPSTTLWKKIGDVKALPLPMACTLTQFMAGYKYYFAVRAVDVRSRLGPFSLPGSILLLNKM